MSLDPKQTIHVMGLNRDTPVLHHEKQMKIWRGIIVSKASLNGKELINLFQKFKNLSNKT